MKFVLGILLVSFLTGSAYGQTLSREARNEIRDYERQLEELTSEYQRNVLRLRVELDERLNAIEREFIEADNLTQARLVEQAQQDTNPSTSIANRLALQKELVGKTYLWKGQGGHRWTFETAHTILSLDNGDVMPWVALTNNEILLIQSNGTLRVLRFNDDLTEWTPFYLPEPVIAGRHGGATLVDER